MVGKIISHYKVLEKIGQGGMGEVYLPEDSRLHRKVALKILPQHLSQRAELRERFEREARAVSSLNHPHICTLYDIGEQAGIHYLVMEHLVGETLEARLALTHAGLSCLLPGYDAHIGLASSRIWHFTACSSAAQKYSSSPSRSLTQPHGADPVSYSFPQPAIQTHDHARTRSDP